MRAKADMRPAVRLKFHLGLILPSASHILSMTQPWQPPKREPPKTKAQLREMLAEAVRNAQAENERLQRAGRVKAT